MIYSKKFLCVHNKNGCVDGKNYLYTEKNLFANFTFFIRKFIIFI